MFWQTGGGQILLGLAANLLFVILLTTVGVIYIKIVLVRRSRPLRRLLGVSTGLPSAVCIMVSNIYVVQSGTLGVRTQRTGFYGPVMNQSEYVFALQLAEAIRTKPIARTFRALLDQLGLLDIQHEPLDCSIVFSPQYVESADGMPVSAAEYVVPDLSGDSAHGERILEALSEPRVYILVGGPAYNAAVEYMLIHLGERTRFRFDLHTGASGSVRGITVIGYKRDGGEEFFTQEPPASEDTATADYFILQKVTRFGPGKSTVFICSGLSSIGTAMAMQLLATRWEDLHREFKDGDFALLYRFRTHHPLAAPAPGNVEIALAGAERLWPHV